jgi:integrase
MRIKFYFRIRKPNDRRKSWSIETNKTGKWVRVTSPEVDAVNISYRSEALSFHQALERLERIRSDLYKHRDHALCQNVLPGNLAIVADFIKEKYTTQKRLRMGERSYQSACIMLNRAIQDIENVPVDGLSEPLQQLIDDRYRQKPGSHRKRITAIHRIRKWRSLDLLLHLNDVMHDVLYITETQFTELLKHLKDPITQELAAFLFYTGARMGEAFAITPQMVRKQGGATLVTISRQMYYDGVLAPTKTRSNRKVFVILGGEDYVTAWAAREDKASYRKVDHNLRIKKAAAKIGVKGFYAHCLRHSYCIHLIGTGCTIDWVAQSAGHSRAVCERYYSTHSLTTDAVTMMYRASVKSRDAS